MRLLLKLNLALRVRVAQEVKLAGGSDRFLLLCRVLPVVIDGVDIVSLDVTGANSAATNPREAVRVTTMVFNAVTITLVPIVAEVTSGLVVAWAGTWDILGLSVVDTSVWLWLWVLRRSDAQNEGAGKCDLGKHYY